LPLLVEGVFQTLPAFSLVGDRLDVFLQDHVLHGCGTDHLAEPA
jgi:hypothetical protein